MGGYHGFTRLHYVDATENLITDSELILRIQKHLRQLAPHVAVRESSILLQGALDEMLVLTQEVSKLKAALNKIAMATGSDDPCRRRVVIARTALLGTAVSNKE
jgi:hypothetical protein